MERSALATKNKNWLIKNWSYKMLYHNDFDYSILEKIIFIKRAGKGINLKYADCIIMADTETSKSKIRPDNHICAWTISIRSYDINIVTLYGHKPTTFVETMEKIHRTINAEKTIFYFHNLSYDWIFIEKFCFNKWSYPEHQLNTKPFYPINIQFENGIEFRDSLILAQKSLEKWANDLDVEHKKAVGFWDYDLIRNQDYEFSPEELTYIEFDTLAGVECLQKTMDVLKKHIYSMPFTATGIPREEVQKRGRKNRAHQEFLKKAFTYEEQCIAENFVYHGGYTHGNRHFRNWINENVTAFDFCSSYPYCLLSEKYPNTKFQHIDNKPLSFILEYVEDNAFIFKLIAFNVLIKDNVSMPALQYSKCINTVNPILDNGRVLYADYLEIYINEIDASIIAQQYTVEKSVCVNVMVSTKEYLPRWFTDYVFELFEAKTKLKGGDSVNYSIAKAKLNSLYGMCCQRPVKQNIIENYQAAEPLEKYKIEEVNSEELYEKYLNKYNSVLLYSTGIYCTSFAMKNLFTLGACAGNWLYSDTDSCYGQNWNMEKVNQYNESVKEKLKANGYGAVTHNGKDYWLGLAEFDGFYSEFKYIGAKRYVCRIDENNIKLTVAGVPKKAGAKCLDNNLDNFTEGFIFSGEATGKKTHQHIVVNEIYIDEENNECGDSLNLTPCDYKLSNAFVGNLEDIFTQEVELQTYE